MIAKEVDLYDPVKRHFQSQGYQVYAEVEVKWCGGRVDLVAYAAPAPIAVEFKTQLSFDLIEQAMKRKNVFPYVYIAIRKRKKPPQDWLIRFMREQGIGFLEVDEDDEVIVRAVARYRRPLMIRHIDFDKLLKPEHQTWVKGGSAGGGYVTEYALTMKGIRSYLSMERKIDHNIAKQVPGKNKPDGWRTAAQIAEHCETHYGTPKSSLVKALLNFEGAWVEGKKENGRWWFRHKEEA